MSDAVIDETNETGMRTALGTLLIERGFLDNQKLDEALRVGADTGERLGEVVVRMGWASEDDLAKILADQWHLRYVERSEISFNGDALSRMSREEATRLEALPIQINDDGAVVVALAEPTDARLLALRSLLGDRIDCVVVTKTAIDAGLRSDLLPKNGSSPAYVAHDDVDAEVETSSVDASVEVNGRRRPDTPTTRRHYDDTASQATTTRPTDFDEVARTLSDAMSSQLASLRQIVVEAERKRERDSTEIARLRAELSDRKTGAGRPERGALRPERRTGRAEHRALRAQHDAPVDAAEAPGAGRHARQTPTSSAARDPKPEQSRRRRDIFAAAPGCLPAASASSIASSARVTIACPSGAQRLAGKPRHASRPHER